MWFLVERLERVDVNALGPTGLNDAHDSAFIRVGLWWACRQTHTHTLMAVVPRYLAELTSTVGA